MTIMGVMQALVSVVQDSKDNLRYIIAGKHKFVFLVREHLLLVGVTRGMDSTQQMLLQLMYVYNQVSTPIGTVARVHVYNQVSTPAWAVAHCMNTTRSVHLCGV